MSGHASPGLATFWLFSSSFIIYQLNIHSRAAYAQCRYMALNKASRNE